MIILTNDMRLIMLLSKYTLSFMALAISKIRKTVFRLLYAFERVYAYAVSKISPPKNAFSHNLRPNNSQPQYSTRSKIVITKIKD